VAVAAGGFHPLAPSPLAAEDTAAFVHEILQRRTGGSAHRPPAAGVEAEAEFSAAFGEARFRVNVFRQRGAYALVVRPAAPAVPVLEGLGLPPVLPELLRRRRGLILLAGPSGSGKSTTLAAMVEHVARHHRRHVVVIESPPEYAFEHGLGVVSQRSVPEDCASYQRAVRAALRQAPDVIAIGDIRDRETAAAALQAAEAGQLVLAALHTKDAMNGIQRLVAFFPPSQARQAQVQVANALLAMLVQQRIPRRGRTGWAVAYEFLLATPPVRHAIRTGALHRLNTFLQSGRALGMRTMEDSLAELVQSGAIEYQDALTSTADPGLFLNLMRKAATASPRRTGVRAEEGRHTFLGLGVEVDMNAFRSYLGLGPQPELTRFAADFSPGAWSTFGTAGRWRLEGGQAVYRPDLAPGLFAQLTDYSIWLGRRPSFALPNHVRVVLAGQPPPDGEAGESRLWVLVISPFGHLALPTAEQEAAAVRPDGTWQTVLLRAPADLVGLPVRAWALRLEDAAVHWQVREVLFF
jgi:twitching motility protein PilT